MTQKQNFHSVPGTTDSARPNPVWTGVNTPTTFAPYEQHVSSIHSLIRGVCKVRIKTVASNRQNIWFCWFGPEWTSGKAQPDRRSALHPFTLKWQSPGLPVCDLKFGEVLLLLVV